MLMFQLRFVIKTMSGSGCRPVLDHSAEPDTSRVNGQTIRDTSLNVSGHPTPQTAFLSIKAAVPSSNPWRE